MWWHDVNRIAKVVLEGDEQSEEFHRQFSAVPRPYDKDLRGIRYEEYKSSREDDH